MTGRHRITDLLGMRVRFADSSDGDGVIDVRLAPSTRVPGPLAELVVDGLVVGRRRPGTLFGYDRHPGQGPWAIRAAVRWLHRDTGYLAWEDVERVDWGTRTVHARTTGLRELTPAR
jgi:hypothetical protein